jgi:hypothetical protein
MSLKTQRSCFRNYRATTNYRKEVAQLKQITGRLSMKSKGARGKNLKPKGARKERSRLRSKRGKNSSITTS